jgi:hypothetical protein
VERPEKTDLSHLPGKSACQPIFATACMWPPSLSSVLPPINALRFALVNTYLLLEYFF